MAITCGIHQAALDNGRWTTAMTLVPVPDPLAPPTFAGAPDQLSEASSYVEHMASLKTKMAGGKGFGKANNQDGGDHAGEEQAGGEEGAARPGGGRRKKNP